MLFSAPFFLALGAEGKLIDQAILVMSELVSKQSQLAGLDGRYVKGAPAWTFEILSRMDMSSRMLRQVV